MGQVFLGYLPAGRAVAVKVIHSELARDPAFRIRFRREVAASRGTKTWSFAAIGAVESAIAVAGGRVYAGSDDSKVYALNASDGTKLWEFDAGGLVAAKALSDPPVQTAHLIAADVPGGG